MVDQTLYKLIFTPFTLFHTLHYMPTATMSARLFLLFLLWISLSSQLLTFASVLDHNAELTKRKSAPVLELLMLFLSPSSKDSFFDFGDNTLTVMPFMQKYIGPQGKYFVVYLNVSDYVPLTTMNTQPDTLFIHSWFHFLSSPPTSSLTGGGIDYDFDVAVDADAGGLLEGDADVADTGTPTTLNMLMKYMPTCPTVIKISTADSMLLRYSSLLNTCRTIFYLSNEFVVTSRDIIDLMLQAGFVLYWHIPVPALTVLDSYSFSDVTNMLAINLLAVPMERHDVSDGFLDGVENVFLFEFGKYYVEQYDMYVKYTSASISLVSGETIDRDRDRNRNSECISDDGSANGGTFLLTQRRDALIDEANIELPFDEEKFPPPPRAYPYHPHTPVPSPTSGAAHSAAVTPKLSIVANTTFALWLHPDLFGNVTLSGSSCIMCSKEEKSLSQVLHFPRYLTKKALRIYTMSICTRLSTVSEYYHHLYHACAAYIRLAYIHQYFPANVIPPPAAPVAVRDSDRDCDSGSASAGAGDSHAEQSMFTSWSKVEPPFFSSSPTSQSAPAPQRDSHGPLNTQAFYDPDLCTDRLWCGQTREFQRSIARWQNPLPTDYAHCEAARFLLYLVPNDPTQSFAEVLMDIGFMLRFALCYDRILVLSFEKFTDSPGSLVALLGSLTSCPISSDMVQAAVYARNGLHVGLYPCQRSQVIWMNTLPTSGHCSSSRVHWTGSYDVLYGHQLGLAGHVIHTDGKGGVLDNTVNEVYHRQSEKHAGMTALFTSRKLVWLGQMIRYIVQPHSVLAASIKTLVQQHLHASPPWNGTSTPSEFVQSSNSIIPRPFAALFLSDQLVAGDDSDSDSERDIERCLRIIRHRSPFIKHIYLPLESMSQFPHIRRTFADFELHFLVFNHTKQTTGYPKKHTDTAGHIIEPLLTQMADVSVAVEADFFLGHLKSPEAEVVNMLQRSRGDGGVDFHSVDAGSSWQGF